jgi:hypothetical protein
MKFTEFKDWALLGLVSSGVFILWMMSQSVATLNEKIAVIIERQESQKSVDQDHEVRLRILENPK